MTGQLRVDSMFTIIQVIVNCTMVWWGGTRTTQVTMWQLKKRMCS